jgi:hypothetical protein
MLIWRYLRLAGVAGSDLLEDLAALTSMAKPPS